jgi:hypothetical protein
VLGTETHDFQGDAVNFTPGSTALNLLEYLTQHLNLLSEL